MPLVRYSILKAKEGRETIFISDLGNPSGIFKDDVRKYCNGLLNSHGGIVYFGVRGNGCVVGSRISRRDEDSYRLTVDHIFSNFMPFVSATHYKLNFIDVTEDGRSKYNVIELKVSVGDIGEIYDDGLHHVYIIDSTRLIGPLHAQELKELIILKYKESMEGAEEASKYATPNIAKVREVARVNEKTKVIKRLASIVEEVTHEVSNRRKLTDYSKDLF